MFPVMGNFNNLKSICQKKKINNAVSRSCPFPFVINIMLLSESWQEADSTTPGYLEFMNLKAMLWVMSAMVIGKYLHVTSAVGFWFPTYL